MSFFAVSQASHSAPSQVWPYWVVGAAVLFGFVALVAGAAEVANARDDRRFGRPDPSSRTDEDDHAIDAGGPSSRPWEQMYQRRGYRADEELAAAEASSAERRATVEDIHNPIGPSASNAKSAADAAEDKSGADA